MGVHHDLTMGPVVTNQASIEPNPLLQVEDGEAMVLLEIAHTRPSLCAARVGDEPAGVTLLPADAPHSRRNHDDRPIPLDEL